MEISRESVAYTHCYCEENVYLLLNQISEPCWAVFVSNEQKIVAFQGHAKESGKTMYWDYHVVAIAKKGDEFIVFDHDHQVCSFPCILSEWLKKTFVPGQRFAPKFRVVSRETLFENFTSDRSHMKDSGQPPPPYPCIINNKDISTNLFSDFVSMKKDEGFGSVTEDLAEFFKSK